MSADTHRLFAEAIDGIAERLTHETVPAIGSLLAVRERDLEAETKLCLRALTGKVPVSRVLEAPGWPSLGRSAVDVVVPEQEDPLRPRHLLELKWCQERQDKVYEAIWDLFKLACLSRLESVESAHLVTGAPVDVWESAFCREIFEGGVFALEELCQRVLPWGKDPWLAWDDLLYGGYDRAPDSVPAPIETGAVGRSRVSQGDLTWEIRAVSVHPGADEVPFAGGWPHGRRPAGARRPVADGANAEVSSSRSPAEAPEDSHEVQPVSLGPRFDQAVGLARTLHFGHARKGTSIPSESSKFFELDSPHPRRVVRQEHGDVLELTAEGWRYAPWLAPCVEGAAAETDLVELQLRCRQRLNCRDLHEQEIPAWDLGHSTHPTLRSAGARLRRLKTWVLPPLPYGAPARFDRRAYEDAEEAVKERLNRRLEDTSLDVSILKQQAQSGHESQEARLLSIEMRATAFESYATATAGLVAIGAAVLSGSRPLELPIVLDLGFALLLFSAMYCLVASGFRAWQAGFKRIDRARPHDSQQALRRATEGDEAAQRAELCGLLVAEHRGFLLEDWKLERLKHCATFFALALIAVLLTALFLLFSTLLA